MTDHDQAATPVYEELIVQDRSCIFETKLRFGAALRNYGNTFFKTGELQQAERAFRRSLYHVDIDELQVQFDLSDEHRGALFAVKIPSLLNLGQCLLKQGKDDSAAEVVTMMDAVLQMDGVNVKALFLRAKANMNLKQWEKAQTDLATAAQLAPTDSAVRTAAKMVKMQLREQDKKSIWKGLFTAQSGDATGAAAIAEQQSAPASAASYALEQAAKMAFFALAMLVAALIAYSFLQSKSNKGEISKGGADEL